jgi:hypothetical protein
VDEGDEGVRFAAAVLGAAADDGRNLATFAGETRAADGFEEFLRAAGGMAFGEEGDGIEVIGRGGVVDDAGGVGHERVVANAAGCHVDAGTAG